MKKNVESELQESGVLALLSMARATSVRLEHCRVAMLLARPAELDDELRRTELAIELLQTGCGQVLAMLRARRLALAPRLRR